MPITFFRGKYAFLSNFHPSPIHLEDGIYANVEAAFQASKTDNPEERAEVRKQNSPTMAKRKGRKVTLRPDWDQVKLEIMHDLVRQKFTRHPELKEKLLATGEEELIEGNNWNDRFWGVSKGQGQNHLGKILMKIRAEVRFKEAGQ